MCWCWGEEIPQLLCSGMEVVLLPLSRGRGEVCLPAVGKEDPPCFFLVPSLLSTVSSGRKVAWQMFDLFYLVFYPQRAV